MLSLKPLFGLALFWGPIIASLPSQQRNILTINAPLDQGWNGTIVEDVSKATEYLKREAGVDIEKFASYLKGISLPQPNEAYAFPSGSGMEGSSIVWMPDELQVTPFKTAANHPDGNNLDVDGQPCDCDCCWKSCIAAIILPPLWIG